MNQATPHTALPGPGLLWVEQADPYPRLCCPCGASLEIDYAQGDQYVQGLLFAFRGRHKTHTKREEQAC